MNYLAQSPPGHPDYTFKLEKVKSPSYPSGRDLSPYDQQPVSQKRQKSVGARRNKSNPKKKSSGKPGGYKRNCSSCSRKRLDKASKSVTRLAQALSEEEDAEPEEFTEVFSWGNDSKGQLGLGAKHSKGYKSRHSLPRYCSFNVTVMQMSCGSEHSCFITA